MHAAILYVTSWYVHLYRGRLTLSNTPEYLVNDKRWCGSVNCSKNPKLNTSVNHVLISSETCTADHEWVQFNHVLASPPLALVVVVVAVVVAAAAAAVLPAVELRFPPSKTTTLLQW